MTQEELDLTREQLKIDLARQRAEMEIDGTKWVNRRAITYMAFFSIIGFTGALFSVVPESKIAPLGDVITVFYFIMASIVGSYFGFSSFEHYNKFKK